MPLPQSSTDETYHLSPVDSHVRARGAGLPGESNYPRRQAIYSHLTSGVNHTVSVAWHDTVTVDEKKVEWP